jgi:Fe-S-cluster containining protein
LDFLSIDISDEDKKLFFERLDHIYQEMEKRYSIVADALDFTCAGCNDNCCYTHFRHHTLIEFLFLAEGINSLDHDLRAEIVQKASEVVSKTSEAEKKGLKIRILCPLNRDGLCVLYRHRLMICRLHGTAHYFDSPKGRVEGPGCFRFEELSEGKKKVPMLDRTDIYRNLAFLEMDLRKKTGYGFKFKHSIAEMVSGAFGGLK